MVIPRFFHQRENGFPRGFPGTGSGAVISLVAGMAAAAALPPANLSFLAYITLAPVIVAALGGGAATGFLCGWLWGMGRAWFAYAFLREINPAIPWLLAPVIALWPGCWAALLPWLWRNTLFDLGTELGGFEARSRHLREGAGALRMTLFIFGTAALFTLIEWTRSRLFVWNDLSVTQWRHPQIIQIASITGSYAVVFLIALVNGGVFALFFRRARLAALPVAIIFAGVVIFGAIRCALPAPAAPDDRPLQIVLIQGDLSQRRHAGLDSAREALDIYRELSRRAIADYPDADLIVWPESAVPLPFFHDRNLEHELLLSDYGALCRDYQRTVRQLAAAGTPFLIGALDTAPSLPVSGHDPGTTNSALHFDGSGRLLAKYDKIHRVPFGEYIPFRSLLPGWVISVIDMGRDLVPGNNFNPLELADGTRFGVAICYEGVFGYLTRDFARRGAQLLVVLSNDAWYPRSSEPEQHLANAVIRAVETGLPMVRVGNNGGSGVVTPHGVFTQGLVTPGGEQRPELGRGRAYGAVEVRPRPVGVGTTIYVRFGEWFVALLALPALGVIVYSSANWRRRKRELLRRSSPHPAVNNHRDEHVPGKIS